MITLVRKFSISVKDYGEKVLPVLYILEDKAEDLWFYVAHPDTAKPTAISYSKVTKILMKDD